MGQRKDQAQFNMRLDRALLKQLQAAAKKEDRSVNSEMVHRLEESFSLRGKIEAELSFMSARIGQLIEQQKDSKAELEGRMRRVEMPPEKVEALMASNKELEARLMASMNDVEKLKAQLSTILESHQSKGGQS
jgi:hypothetical protein